MRMNENLQKIPEIKFTERKALVILTTQRSGSTMLCEDITSLRILGSPNEHFDYMLNKSKGKNREELLGDFKSRGNVFNSDFYSIKLMYSDLPKFGYWVSDRVKQYGNPINDEIFREISIRFFLEKFENATFIYLKRTNKFEQALSHYRAMKTSKWHMWNMKTDQPHKSHSPNEEDQLLNNIDVELFDDLYDFSCKSDRELELILKKLGIDYLPLVYEEIKNDYPNYLLDISAKAGVKINIDSLDGRKIQKITSNDFVVKFKNSLRKKTNKNYI